MREISPCGNDYDRRDYALMEKGNGTRIADTFA